LPTAKVLSLAHFQTLINDKLRYKPSNPKDLPTLYQFFELKKEGTPQGAPVDGARFISIDKLVE